MTKQDFLKKYSGSDENFIRDVDLLIQHEKSQVQEKLDPEYWEEDEDDLEEEQHAREYKEWIEIAEKCSCGAWVFTGSGVEHVSDCICGADTGA